jgi:positive regulator of sigma E activity
MLFLFGGIAAGPWIFPSLGDLSSLIFGVAGLAAAFFIARAVSARAAKTRMFKPFLVRIIKRF